MKVRFFDPARGYNAICPEIYLEIQRVLSAGDLILRKDVELFEENLAKFVGTKYAVALNSGTDAIYLALKALQWERKVVGVPAHTFKSTCGAIIHAEAHPAVRDMDEELNTGYSVVVHIAGELSPIPKGEVIEDACQALGAVKNPTTRAQCWSFYPAKILGAYGDAGALTTNDKNIADYVRQARNHFKGDNRDFGINSRMDNLQAAILNVKFKYLGVYLEARRQIADMYWKNLRDLHFLKKLILPDFSKKRVWQDFIVRTPVRDALYDALKAQGVETMKNEYPWSVTYPKPLGATQFEYETLRLPCNPDLTEEEVHYVINKIIEFYV